MILSSTCVATARLTILDRLVENRRSSTSLFSLPLSAQFLTTYHCLNQILSLKLAIALANKETFFVEFHRSRKRLLLLNLLKVLALLLWQFMEGIAVAHVKREIEREIYKQSVHILNHSLRFQLLIVIELAQSNLSLLVFYDNNNTTPTVLPH